MIAPFKEFLTDSLLVVQDNLWFVESMIILTFAWLVLSLWKYVQKRLLDYSVARKICYFQYSVEASRRPVEFSIYYFSVMTCLIVSLSTFGIEIEKTLYVIRHIGILLLVLWFILRFTSRFENAVYSGVIIIENKTKFSTLLTVFRIVIYFLFFLFILQAMGFSLKGMVTFGSVGAIVIGFASKTFLENALGYTTVTSNRKFEIGHYIRVDELNVSGFVESMTLPSTGIRDDEKNLVYVPNGAFLTKAVVNVSKMTNRRVSIDVPVYPENRVELLSALKNIRKVLGRDDRVDQSLRILCNVKQYNPEQGYFILLIDFYLKVTQVERFFAERQDFIFMVFDMLEKMDIPFALSRQQEYQLLGSDNVMSVVDTSVEV